MKAQSRKRLASEYIGDVAANAMVNRLAAELVNTNLAGKYTVGKWDTGKLAEVTDGAGEKVFVAVYVIVVTEHKTRR